MSSNTAPSWSWDPNRQKYYLLDYQASCLVYQDGERIQLTPAKLQQFAAAQQASQTPQPVQSLTAQTSPQAESAQHRVIRGSGEGSVEPLDPRYKVRRPAGDFFKRGRVFRVLWSEPAGPHRGTVLSDGLFSGESFHIKIRWFVVIREGSNFCSCLPIQTYEGKGVSKPSVVKSHHGIIHTSRGAPKEAPEERSARGEEPMQPPVRVSTRSRADKMDDMSRVNYAKPYPVEHNVKVYDFGVIAKQSFRQFIRNFNKVWKSTEMPESEESSDDDDNDDDGDNDNDGAGSSAPSSSALAAYATQLQAQLQSADPSTRAAVAAQLQAQLQQAAAGQSSQGAYTQLQTAAPGSQAAYAAQLQAASPSSQAAYAAQFQAASPDAQATYASQLQQLQAASPSSQAAYNTAQLQTTSPGSQATYASQHQAASTGTQASYSTQFQAASPGTQSSYSTQSQVASPGTQAAYAAQLQEVQQSLASTTLGESQGSQRTPQAVEAEYNQTVQGWVAHLRRTGTEQGNRAADYLLHASRDEQIKYMQALASQRSSASAESSKRGKEKVYRKP